MPDAVCRRTPFRPLLFCVLGLLTLAGCQDDKITHSIVPRATEPEKTRLLGVIYPRGDQTWFFKLTGPESAVSDVAEPFNVFMNSVRFNDKAETPVTWTLPEGWKEEMGPKPRYATLRLGTKEKPIELTVSKLGKEAAAILPNVNRWRGQLGLAPVDETGLAAVTKEIKVNDGAAVLVDMTGSGAAGKSMAGAMAAKRSFTYQKPDDWLEAPHPEAGVVAREALFEVSDGNQNAEVSVTKLGGMAGGLLANVARWANQMGAPEVTAEQLDKFPKITIAGHEAPYIDLAGTKGRTIGVIVSDGDKTWFFKMTGPSDVVEKHKSELEAFLKSVKFPGGQGGEQ